MSEAGKKKNHERVVSLDVNISGCYDSKIMKLGSSGDVFRRVEYSFNYNLGTGV